MPNIFDAVVYNKKLVTVNIEGLTSKNFTYEIKKVSTTTSFSSSSNNTTITNSSRFLLGQ